MTIDEHKKPLFEAYCNAWRMSESLLRFLQNEYKEIYIGRKPCKKCGAFRGAFHKDNCENERCPFCKRLRCLCLENGLPFEFVEKNGLDGYG